MSKRANNFGPRRLGPARGLTALALLLILTLPFVLPGQAINRSASARSIETDDAADAGKISTSTREGRLAVFDDLWQTVAERYYTDGYHGVDWVAQRSHYRGLAAEAHDARELYAGLRKLLSLLKDAHTRVYAPEEKFDWQHPRFLGIGVSLREVEGHPTVFMIEHGSAAERAGLRAGDVIETIDGEPATALLAKREHEQPSSSPRAAHLLALGALTDGPKEKNVTLKWRDVHSLEHQASFPRHWRERNYAVRAQRFGKGFVEIEIEAFTRTLVFELIGSARDPLRNARGIVLDLRNNGGGDATAMAEVASLFLPPATPLGQFIDRQGRVALALATNAMYASALDRNKRPPLVILTSERTSSAAEILIAALQHATNVTVIGGQTCGCVLAVRAPHALPDGGELEVSELDFRTAKGVRLEGLGITPDETVNLSRRDLYTHRDRIREVAVAKLHRSASLN